MPGTAAKKEIYPILMPTPYLDLGRIRPGKILTVCFAFVGDAENRIRVSFEIKHSARPATGKPARGIISEFHSSQEIIQAFREFDIRTPEPGTECFIFGSCAKTETGIKELTANFIFRGKYLYWATASSNGDHGWFFPDPIGMWLIH